MTCKNCVSYEVCRIVRSNGDDRVLENSPCKHFKNKADFVEVVRCKDCKYGDVSCHSLSKDGEKKIANICSLIKKRTSVDYYCPCGERAVNYESSKTERK